MRIPPSSPRFLHPVSRRPSFTGLFRAAFVLVALPTAALAHPGHGGGELTWDFSAGFAHPFSGWDHLLAMVAVGLWATQLGGRARWRAMPWMVILFGVAVGPLGAVSVLLVILQPILFDSWCTLCLASAVISVGMIGPAMDEVLAGLQHVRREQRRGRSAWRAFWGLGGRHEQDRVAGVAGLSQPGRA